MPHPIEPRLAELTDRLERIRQALEEDDYLPFLFLLEHPPHEVQARVLPALDAAGLHELSHLFSLQRLVGYALRFEGSGYWNELAAQWLKDGLEPDARLTEEVATAVREKAGTQRSRHTAQKAMSAWARSRQGYS